MAMDELEHLKKKTETRVRMELIERMKYQY